MLEEKQNRQWQKQPQITLRRLIDINRDLSRDDIQTLNMFMKKKNWTALHPVEFIHRSQVRGSTGHGTHFNR